MIWDMSWNTVLHILLTTTASLADMKRMGEKRKSSGGSTMIIIWPPPPLCRGNWNRVRATSTYHIKWTANLLNVWKMKYELAQKKQHTQEPKTDWSSREALPVQNVVAPEITLSVCSLWGVCRPLYLLPSLYMLLDWTKWKVYLITVRTHVRTVSCCGWAQA